MARPRPVPPNRRVVDKSACENGWKSFSRASGRSRCRCLSRQNGVAGRRPSCPRQRHFDEDFAALGELDRVADQVGQDLAEAAESPRTNAAALRDGQLDELEAL